MPGAHELPSMPQFPPLAMPTALSSDNEEATDAQSSALDHLRSPVPSVADSFSTAYTSPSRDQEDVDSQRRLLSPPFTNTLRKSISVDSFVNINSNITRSNRGNSNAQLSSPRSPTFQQDSYPSGEQDRFWSSRGGASVSSIQDGYESPSLLDSDVEHFDPTHTPGDRYRHVSLKGHQEPQRPAPRGGELLLPARSTQALSATSSMSSIATESASSSPREAHAILRSVPPLQASSQRQNQTLRKDIGRARSGSLGVHVVPNPTKRMTINTHVRTIYLMSCLRQA